MPENLKLLESFLIAVALGALIGAERGIGITRGEEKERKTFAGIRTFVLISLLGALCLYFGKSFGDLFFTASFFGFILLVVAAYIITSKVNDDVGTTTEITAILTFLYGALCVTDYRIAAVVLAIFTTLILYTKKYSHAFVSRITDEEFYATLKFAIIAFAILPFLPQTDYFGFLNPYKIWVIVVVISAIEFTSYIIMKLMPPKRGIAIVGLLSGIISSTALMVSASEQSKKDDTLTNSLAFSTALARSTVFFKLIAEVYLVNKALLGEVLIPLVLMFVLGIISAVFLWRRSKEEKDVDISHIKSPFTLTPALKFGAIFTLIILLTTFANKYLGVGGIYISSALSGTINIDAPVLSLAGLANGGITPQIATIGIMMAVLVNTVSKVVVTFWLGSREFAKLVALSASLQIIGAIAYIVFLLI